MNKKLDTITIEIDQDVYDQAVVLFTKIGTTIEDMAVAFIEFCVIPENLPLLEAYLCKEKAPADADARLALHLNIFEQVYKIATEKKKQMENADANL